MRDEVLNPEVFCAFREAQMLISRWREEYNHFRPEFINRIDDQIIFRSLDEKDVRRIVKPMLAEICQTLQK
jgi:ATP-dependent Clp protease ATP-binding subunit ClpA